MKIFLFILGTFLLFAGVFGIYFGIQDGGSDYLFWGGTFVLLGLGFIYLFTINEPKR